MIQTLFDFRMVDQIQFISNPQYGFGSIQMMLEATNVARTQLMGMAPIQVYNLKEEED